MSVFERGGDWLRKTFGPEQLEACEMLLKRITTEIKTIQGLLPLMIEKARALPCDDVMAPGRLEVGQWSYLLDKDSKAYRKLEVQTLIRQSIKSIIDAIQEYRRTDQLFGGTQLGIACNNFCVGYKDKSFAELPDLLNAVLAAQAGGAPYR